MLSRMLRTVLSVLVARFLAAPGSSGSYPWSGNAGAGSLTPTGAASGLVGPMPLLIALVSRGRCRPSPDAVPEGAARWSALVSTPITPHPTARAR
jgi:hypothetical protein